MRRHCIGSLAAAGLLLAGGMALDYAKQRDATAIPAARSVPVAKLQAARQSSSDLEVGGELAGLPPGVTRYITREDLLTLPQATYTVSDDSNFTGPTKISGVPLEDLARSLGAAPQAAMVVAICDDKYRANYPREYVAAHHPLLVLAVNGQPPSGWPKDSEGHGYDMGPYMISHPIFKPSFKIFSHADEPQVPWGVVRIEFRNENTVFGAILPRARHAATPLVKAGYRIAQQNCFRCHNMGREVDRSPVLPGWCSRRGHGFARILRRLCARPAIQESSCGDARQLGYDDATIGALITYFRTFSPHAPEGKP